ncbi:MAG: hypothetical protein DWQ10_13755 [Calditrichaeota bacterium]|nr:MAG: hypothetical protein DWQ10_13755 [Calditrichota bacterium]
MPIYFSDVQNIDDMPYSYHSCVQGPIQFRFMCKKNAQGVNNLRYVLQPNLVNKFSGRPLIEKLTVRELRGNTVHFQINNIEFSQSHYMLNHKYYSKAFHLNLPSGSYRVELYLGDSQSEMTLHRTCNIQINADGTIQSSGNHLQTQKHRLFSV